MADSSIAVTPGTGANIDTRTEGTNSDHRQVVVIGDPATNAGVAPVDVTNGLAVDVKGNGLTSLQLIDDVIFTDDTAFTPATSKVAVIGGQLDDSSTDSVDEGDAGALRMTPDRRLYTAAKFATVKTDVTRVADTIAYAANDAWSDSTSAPTSGGFTFTSAASKSGGSGVIMDAIVATSADAATLLQGEIWIFDTSVTNVNDNTAFAVSDSEIKTCVGKIPFLMEDAGNNGLYHAKNLNIGFTASGSANLRFLVRVKNAYTPASSEVLSTTLKILQFD